MVCTAMGEMPSVKLPSNASASICIVSLASRKRRFVNCIASRRLSSTATSCAASVFSDEATPVPTVSLLSSIFGLWGLLT